MRRAPALALCLALAVVSYADTDVTKVWAATLAETSKAIHEQRYDDARVRLEKLLRQMMERVGRGEAADRMFAVVLTQRALAEAGSGREADAVWHWHVAQSLYPAVRDADLTQYGAAGELLRANVLAPAPPGCGKRAGPVPVPVKRIEPAYPEGARQFSESGLIIVEIRLDAEGRPIHPRILKGLAAPVNYAALDALRRWRYNPPAADDPMKDVPFCTTFKFILR